MAGTSMMVDGLYIAYVWKVDANGYPMGQLVDTTAPVAGTVYSPYLISAPVTYKAATPTYEQAISRAAMTTRGQRDHGIASLGTGTFTTSEWDETLNQMRGGSTVDAATATALTITSPNRRKRSPTRLGMAFIPAATPGDGTEDFLTIMLCNISLRPPALGANSSGGSNPNNLDWEIVPNFATRTPLGLLFSATGLAVSGNTDTEIFIHAPAPMMMTTYVGDGSVATFTLPYSPYSTEHAQAYNIFSKNGAEDHSGITSVVGSVVTKSSAGTTLDKEIVVFPSLGALAA